MKRDNNTSTKSFRSLKISSIIKRKLGSLFISMNDKRLGIITVNNVLLSKDLRYAKIYIFFLNNLSINETIAILNKSSSYLRKKLLTVSNINYIPQMSFYYDKSIILNNRISALLKNNGCEK